MSSLHSRWRCSFIQFVQRPIHAPPRLWAVPPRLSSKQWQCWLDQWVEHRSFPTLEIATLAVSFFTPLSFRRSMLWYRWSVLQTINAVVQVVCPSVLQTINAVVCPSDDQCCGLSFRRSMLWYKWSVLQTINAVVQVVSPSVLQTINAVVCPSDDQCCGLSFRRSMLWYKWSVLLSFRRSMLWYRWSVLQTINVVVCPSVLQTISAVVCPSDNQCCGTGGLSFRRSMLWSVLLSFRQSVLWSVLQTINDDCSDWKTSQFTLPL